MASINKKTRFITLNGTIKTPSGLIFTNHTDIVNKLKKAYPLF
jgi:hypothetical protein